MENPGEQLVDAVDKNDMVIGTVKRKDIFSRKANFRVVHIFLLNRKGELLLQKIAGGRGRHARQWGSSAADYVISGESYDEAAKRCLERELRLKNSLMEFMGKACMNDDDCRKFISLYKVVHEGPLTLDPAYTEGAEFLSFREIAELSEKSRRKFTPTFLYLLDFLMEKGKAKRK